MSSGLASGLSIMYFESKRYGRKLPTSAISMGPASEVEVARACFFSKSRIFCKESLLKL